MKERISVNKVIKKRLKGEKIEGKCNIVVRTNSTKLRGLCQTM